ncbi:MAG: hypothetical protein ACI32H_05210 [Bacilli bacterium]
MKEKLKDKITGFMSSIKDYTDSFSLEEIESGKALSIVSYLIPLVPFILSKKNNYVKFHTLNGMNILFTYLIFLIIKRTLSYIFGTPCDLVSGLKCIILPISLRIFFAFINMIFSFIILYGILNVCNNKAKEIPIISKIKLFK